MPFDIHFSPLSLATRDGGEDAQLVLVEGRLAAILARIAREVTDTGEDGWFLQAGFGPCEAEGILFPGLGAAEVWVREQLREKSRWAPPIRSGQPGFGERPAETLRPLRVLIVEDNGVHALDLEGHIRDLGHEVVETAPSAPDAVAAAAIHRPDLVFMDVRLADGTDGIKAARAIHDRLGIPSVFITGLTDSGTLARIAQVKPLELLVKPTSAPAVTAALRRAAELRACNRLF